jgi:hypothetical protein
MTTNYTQSPFNKERQDKFLLVIPVPEVLKDDVSKTVRSNEFVNPDSVQFSIYGSIIPPIDIPEIEVRYAGQNLHVTSHNRLTYPPIDVNFTIDNRFNNYWFIYKWLDKLQDDYKAYFDADNNLDIGEVVERKYMADFTIYGLDEYNKKIVQFNFTKGFPTNLGGIEYNYRNPNEIETTFRLAYSQFKVGLVQV